MEAVMSGNEERAAIRIAIGSVLHNASNFPEKVASRILGQDMAPLIERTTDAVIAHLAAVVAPKISEQQVWQMARFQHDFVLDSDNVPAFVEPLLGALREAGIPFDEEPFIDGGFLLPAEATLAAHPATGTALQEHNAKLITEFMGQPEFKEMLESVKREAAAVALEEAAKAAEERTKEYSETAHRLIAERAFEDSSRYSNYAAGLTMAAGISRKLATTTRNPRTPGEETAP